jgi:exopolysaccharide biosynthesis polyprenyl glycosylphosphotransferase
VTESLNQEALKTVLESPPVRSASDVRGLPLRAPVYWRLTRAAVDFATVFAAAYGSYLAYLVSGVGLSHYAPEYYARLDLVLAGVTTFAMYGRGSSRGQLGLLRIEWVCRMLRAVASAVFLILAASFFLQLPQFSRFHMLLAGPVVAVALLVQRFVFWRLQAAARGSGRDTTPALVYGAGETGRLLAQQLLEERTVVLTPCAFLDDRAELRFSEVRVGPGVNGVRLPVLGGEDDLAAALERTHARAVFLAMPSAPPERIAHIIAKLEDAGLPFYCVPSSGNLLFSSLSFGQVGSIPVYTRRVATRDSIRDAMERVIDVAGAATILALTSPLLVAGAIAVKLDSAGPVFFRQERVGIGGRKFTIFKLRTMLEDTAAYAEHPRTAEDSRVTRAGRVLRRTCIDELPQLWNVLRGDMSLVGPRPEMPQIVGEYHDIERQRLSVKPGITGLWQISADRAFRIHDNMQYDLYYVEHRGFTLDLAILLMTPFVMMAHDRAL